VKVLFDHNVPHKLRRSLVGHDVYTADEMGWARLENGDLLRAAEGSNFEVMVTGDKNISYQQSFAGRKLSLIVLENTDWNVIKLNPHPVVEALKKVASGSFQVVSFRV
jgi:predicted nuclease of predicted toxin-antitoxin system